MNILIETLKTNNKWSSRKLTMFVSFSLGCILGSYVVFSDYFLTKEINSYAIIVVGYLFGMATGQALIISKDKKVEIENNNQN